MASLENPVELNGVTLTDLESARKALDYLHDDYHEGRLSVAEGGHVLVVISRGSAWGNYSYIKESEALTISNVRAVDLGEENELGEYEPDVRLKLEIREADG